MRRVALHPKYKKLSDNTKRTVSIEFWRDAAVRASSGSSPANLRGQPTLCAIFLTCHFFSKKKKSRTACAALGLHIWGSLQVSLQFPKFEQIWANLSKFEHIWASLSKCEQIWGSLQVSLQFPGATYYYTIIYHLYYTRTNFFTYTTLFATHITTQ